MVVIDLISDEETDEFNHNQGNFCIPTINSHFGDNTGNVETVMNLYNENSLESEGTQRSYSASQIEVKRSTKVTKVPNNKLIGIVIDERLQQNSIFAMALSEDFLLHSVSSIATDSLPISDSNNCSAIQDKYFYIFVKSTVTNLIRWVYEPFVQLFPTGHASKCSRFAHIAVVLISDCVSFMTLLLSSPDGVEFNKLEEYVNVLMESMKRDDHCHEECRLVLTFNQTDLNKAIQSAQRKEQKANSFRQVSDFFDSAVAFLAYSLDIEVFK
eukprot:gene32656-43643_t